MITWTVILALATWRLSSLLYIESPFGWLRKMLKIDDDVTTGARSVPDNIVGKLFDCFWCFSLVVGFLLSIPVYILTDFDMSDMIFIWLASSTIVLALDVRYFSRLRS